LFLHFIVGWPPIPFILRLPRDTSHTIVGLSSSTSLHFAAAIGHSNVVRTRLLHATHADQADKHEVMPKMLVRESGKEGTAADVLKT